jgi:hypothetical protein
VRKKAVQVEESGGRPPGVDSTGFELFVDEAQGTAIFVGYFETEQKMRDASAAFEQMEPSETPGTRASVDLCEVKAQRRFPEGSTTASALYSRPAAVTELDGVTILPEPGTPKLLRGVGEHGCEVADKRVEVDEREVIGSRVGGRSGSVTPCRVVVAEDRGGGCRPGLMHDVCNAGSELCV